MQPRGQTRITHIATIFWALKSFLEQHKQEQTFTSLHTSELLGQPECMNALTPVNNLTHLDYSYSNSCVLDSPALFIFGMTTIRLQGQGKELPCDVRTISQSMFPLQYELYHRKVGFDKQSLTDSLVFHSGKSHLVEQWCSTASFHRREGISRFSKSCTSPTFTWRMLAKYRILILP